MRLGLFMMPLHPSYRPIADAYDRDIDQLVLADRLGFDEAWIGEHFTEKCENAPAPDLLIAKALALTERIRFGTGVTLLGTIQMTCMKRDPAMPGDAIDVDYLMDNLWIVGDPQECAGKIRDLHKATGGFGTLLATTCDSDDASWDHESLTLLAEDVAPRFADPG